MSKHDVRIPNPTLVKETPPRLHLLSMVNIFRDLSHDEMEEINKMVNMITIKEGQVLYHPDEEAEVLFLL